MTTPRTTRAKTARCIRRLAISAKPVQRQSVTGGATLPAFRFGPRATGWREPAQGSGSVVSTSPTARAKRVNFTGRTGTPTPGGRPCRICGAGAAGPDRLCRGRVSRRHGGVRAATRRFPRGYGSSGWRRSVCRTPPQPKGGPMYSGRTAIPAITTMQLGWLNSRCCEPPRPAAATSRPDQPPRLAATTSRPDQPPRPAAPTSSHDQPPRPAAAISRADRAIGPGRILASRPAKQSRGDIRGRTGRAEQAGRNRPVPCAPNRRHRRRSAAKRGASISGAIAVVGIAGSGCAGGAIRCPRHLGCR